MVLNNLPPSKDEYWEHAETITMQTPLPKPTCQHHFISKSGRRAECDRCHIGYYLDPGFSVKENHIYDGNKLVI